MPYTTSSADLPDNVKALDDAKKSRWVSIWNSAFERCQERDGDDCEGAAFRQANGVVFDEMAIFTPPIKCGIEGPLSARGVRLLVEADGAVGKWARKLTRKLEMNKEQSMELTETVKDKPVTKEPISEMSDIMAMGYAPGATSFADLRAVEHATMAAAEIRGWTYQFQSLVDNVFADPAIVDKIAAIENLAAEFVELVRGELDEAVEENLQVDSANEIIVNVTPEEAAKAISRATPGESLTESDDLQDAALAIEVARDATEADLSEAGIQAAENGRRAPVVVNFRILQPGPGNKRDNRYYPADVVRRDIHVFEGADVFATDHKATERNERTKVGKVLQCPASFTENGAPIAPVLIYDPAQAEKARNRNDAGALDTLECSIFGKGRAKVGEIGGQEYKIVEAITEGTFLELVSKAGAGGQAQSLQESHGGDPMKDELETVQAETETVQAEVEITQVVEVDIQENDVKETEESKTEPVAEDKPVTETEPVAEIEPTAILESGVVAVMLNETNLPQSFRKALSVAKYADSAALQSAIDEAVKDVKTLTGSGQPFAQGVSESVDEPKLTEAEVAEQNTSQFNKIMVDIGLPVRS